MTAPFLDPTISLTDLRDHIVYSRLALARDPRAVDLAPEYAALEVEWREVFHAQLAHWDAQTAADLDVDASDEAIDTEITAFDIALRQSTGDDRTHPRYALYFTLSPSRLKRPVLGEELETVRGWDALFEAEDVAAISALRPRFAGLVTRADEALAAEQAADTQNRQFRSVGPLAQFIAKVKATRDRTFSTLESRRTSKTDPLRVSADWSSSFFRSKPSPRPTQEQREALAAAREEAKKKKQEDAQKATELRAQIKKAQADLAAIEKKK